MSNQPMSANQKWKASGTTLSFPEFMNREKAKAKSLSADGLGEPEMMINKPLNQAVQDSLASARADAGLKTKVSGNTILGINKYLIIGSAVIIVGAIAYNIYKKAKK